MEVRRKVVGASTWIFWKYSNLIQVFWKAGNVLIRHSSVLYMNVYDYGITINPVLMNADMHRSTMNYSESITTYLVLCKAVSAERKIHQSPPSWFPVHLVENCEHLIHSCDKQNFDSIIRSGPWHPEFSLCVECFQVLLFSQNLDVGDHFYLNVKRKYIRRPPDP